MLGVLDLLLPASCPACRRPGTSPCADCIADLPPAPAMAPPPGVDAVHAVVAYEDAGRALVTRLKYRNARSVVSWLAGRMAALVAASLVGLSVVGGPPGFAPPACVTWIPTSQSRRADRGFDQSELLARAVARRLGLPCRRLLVRDRGPPQTGRSLTERRRGPPIRARGRAPTTVVLIDDVITTGSSARTAAAALRGAGAVRVIVVAAARTPYRAHASAR
jgi:predicted amidophosphoribosyltransferase